MRIASFTETSTIGRASLVPRLLPFPFQQTKNLQSVAGGALRKVRIGTEGRRYAGPKEGEEVCAEPADRANLAPRAQGMSQDESADKAAHGERKKRAGGQNQNLPEYPQPFLGVFGLSLYAVA